LRHAERKRDTKAACCIIRTWGTEKGANEGSSKTNPALSASPFPAWSYPTSALPTTSLDPAVKLSIPWVGELRAISALDRTWRGLMSAEFRNRAFRCGPAGAPDMMGTGALGIYSQFLPTNPRFNMIR
jgi:hypothetical protein